MQDQAFLGPESGLAVPDGEGWVDLYVSTQWLHVERDLLAASLALAPERVRITLAGVGGAVKAACEAVRARVLDLAATKLGRAASELALVGGDVVAGDGGKTGRVTGEGAGPAGGSVLLPLADLLGAEAVEEMREYHHHRQTRALDAETGQGDAHVAFAFAAHRAVVDVDTELGLVKVVDATAQDVGKAINPQAVEGQIEGGIAQGLGLALMEEIQVADGKVRNPSLPTT